MRLNHNDMSGIYHGMMAEQFKKAYQGEKKNMWLMASDPRVYTSTLIKKEEQEKLKEFSLPVRYRVWRDIMQNDDMMSYPFAEENILSDLMDDDVDIKSALQMSQKVSKTILDFNNQKRDALDQLDELKDDSNDDMGNIVESGKNLSAAALIQ